MKPIMSQQVQRGKRLEEWESAEHQATLDGVNEFWKRQQERMARFQKPASKIVTLKRDKA